MKKLITCIALFYNLHCFAADTAMVSVNGNHFFYLTQPENTSVIFFLHGGVSNSYFENNKENSELGFILEGNTKFIEESMKNGFDLIIPITNDSLNWISKPDYCFNVFKTHLEQKQQKYDAVYISGFSDGGTGSFKIFYSHPNAFDGLIVFNGYPYLNNFASSVDYFNVVSKKIIFVGTKDDHITPYEFMLMTYCKQKITNPSTYLYVVDGKHSFSFYSDQDFIEVFGILNAKIDNLKTEPLHGYVRHDELIYFYKFKKSIVKKYSIGQEYYNQNKSQQKALENSK